MKYRTLGSTGMVVSVVGAAVQRDRGRWIIATGRRGCAQM